MAARVVSSTETAGVPLGKSIASSPPLRGKIWTILAGGSVKVISMGKPKEKKHRFSMGKPTEKENYIFFPIYWPHYNGVPLRRG